jgi:hypothetical protein
VVVRRSPAAAFVTVTEPAVTVRRRVSLAAGSGDAL